MKYKKGGQSQGEGYNTCLPFKDFLISKFGAVRGNLTIGEGRLTMHWVGDGRK